MEEENRAFSDFGLEPDLASVFHYDDGIGQSEALPGALTGLVVKKGSKTRERIASGMPIPVSATEISAKAS